MIIYPNLYIENITKINKEIIVKYKIKAMLLDVDNTILNYDGKMIDGLEQWAEATKNMGVKLCILSNSNKEEKVKKVANLLNIPYIFFAKKPLKKGYKKAQKLLNIEAKHIAMVGDQIFTDVIGANRVKMISILTKPLEEKDIWVTKLKRPFEEFVVKRYLKRREK